MTQPNRWSDGSEEGTLVNWLRDGRIVHDRDGRLAMAQERVRREPPPAFAADGDIHEARRKISYNVAQLNRYLAADDPASHVAVDLRLLYSLFEVALHYFTVRRLPWRGEKPAARHWMARDPEFLDVLRRCFAASDRRHKAASYVELARRALAPVGELWESHASLVEVGAAWGAGRSPSGDVIDARDFWLQLVGGDTRNEQ